MYAIFNKLQPGISPHLSTPPRILESVIPSHDISKKICPFSNDSGITMQIKYEPSQNYPNCIFGNKYKLRYPHLDDHIRRGLSVYKLNNRLSPIKMNIDIFRDDEKQEKEEKDRYIYNPHTWMSHVDNYTIHFKNNIDGWKKYIDIRGDRNAELNCRLFGNIYNNPLDLFELIKEEMKKKAKQTKSSTSSVSSVTTTTSSSCSSSSCHTINNNTATTRVEDEQEFDIDIDDLDLELEPELEVEEDLTAENENENEAEPQEQVDQGSTKTSGGKCMDLLKTLYRFIYSVSLQAWVMTRNRFMNRKNHDQSQYEYIFFLVPKDDIKNVSYILNANTDNPKKNSTANMEGVKCINRFKEAMIYSENDQDDQNNQKSVDYIMSVSASEFIACSLRYIIDILLQRSIVTEQTAVEQKKYAISITNVCMLNSVTITGMQSIPFDDEFIIYYNFALGEAASLPDITTFVDQQFSKHFQYKFKVNGLKRLKFKNLYAFPVFVSGVFFTPDRPLNKMCHSSILLHQEKALMVSNVTRSYFTYGAYFTPNSHIICKQLPDTETFPSFLVRRCAHWYSLDKKSSLMYLSSFYPDDDIDPTLSDIDLCAVSELEWFNCIKDIKISVNIPQFLELLFDEFDCLYSTVFWPIEYNALEHLGTPETNWQELTTQFYVLYLALTKVIVDPCLCDSLNIRQYTGNDHIIMYILFKYFKWKNLSQCIQTLRLGRKNLIDITSSVSDGNVKFEGPWRPETLESSVQMNVGNSFSIFATQDQQIPQHDINELIRVCMIYMSGDKSYKESRLFEIYTKFECFRICFVDGKSTIETLSKYFKYYTKESCLNTEDGESVFMESLDSLIDYISIHIITHFIAPKAMEYFLFNTHPQYRILKTEDIYVNKDEVRTCLSFPISSENKRILNLEPIVQAYSLISNSQESTIACSKEEYLVLLNSRNILLLSNDEENESIHPEFLNILENVLNKMYVRDLPDHKRRKLQQLPCVTKQEKQE